MGAIFGHKIKPDKGQKIVSAMRQSLLPGEEVLMIAKCNNLRPLCDQLVITNFRVTGVSGGKIAVEFRYAQSLHLLADSKKESVTVTTQDGQSMVFKMVQREDHEAIERAFREAEAAPPPVEALAAFEQAEAALTSEASRLQQAKMREWPDTRLVGGRLTGRASQAVLRQCLGSEQPWLILVSGGGAGLLTAFDDRLAIIKTGAFTSLMAGSLGGERAATFHFRDITGVEYNSGLFNGVLEILTPSYNGSQNRDFWRGTFDSRNADSNDPWTLSNCLPLAKYEYKAVLPEITDLRSRISHAKASGSESSVSGASSGLAEELQKLADLRDAGVLTDEEFADAKRRVLDESGRR